MIGARHADGEVRKEERSNIEQVLQRRRAARPQSKGAPRSIGAYDPRSSPCLEGALQEVGVEGPEHGWSAGA